MRRAVFLDRDNTLMSNDCDCGDPGAVVLLPGVGHGVALLRRAGFLLVVATNQGGVARGRFNERDVDAVHARLAALIDEASGVKDAIDRFYFCPWHPEATIVRYRGEHPWRKPNPGMILHAAEELGIDLAASWFIGDAPRDVIAGRRAGCRTVLIDPGYVALPVPVAPRCPAVPCRPAPVPSNDSAVGRNNEAVPAFVATDFLSAVACVIGTGAAPRSTPPRREAPTP